MKIKRTGSLYVLMAADGTPVDCFRNKKEASKNFHKYARHDMLNDIDRTHSWENYYDYECGRLN